MNSFFNKRFSSFTYLNITQFLGALNDNIYKLLVVYSLIDLQGIGESHKILATTGAIFVLPFLLFSSMSGTLADRFSKRNIIVLTKALELIVMACGVLSFAYNSPWGLYATLFLLATQSALFGPSKYGILPELVSTDRITRANGLMTSFTFLAIILGTFIASFITDITGRNFILGSLLCTILSLIGVITSIGIEYTPPSGSDKKVDALFLKEIYKTISLARTVPSLLPAMLGSSYFLFLGAFIQLNIIPFAVHSLSLTDVQGGYLFLLTALGIGTGCMIAGKLSGKSVELGLVPLAGIGITIGLFLLDFFSGHLIPVILSVVGIGILGGIYEIPLDSYIQVSAPNQFRGQIVGATNFLSFIGVLCASVAIYMITEVFNLHADKGFTIMGFLTLFVAIAFTFQFFDYLTRFVGMVLSKMHFHTISSGQDNIPDKPVIYVCSHKAWNDTLLLLGAQKRRIRFFIEQEQQHSKLMRQLYLLLRVVFIPPIEPMEHNEKFLLSLKRTLEKGISVCIFIENSDVLGEIEKLKQSETFNHILKDLNYPIIPVVIDKGQKCPKKKRFACLMKKFRVPASISFGSSTQLQFATQ